MCLPVQVGLLVTITDRAYDAHPTHFSPEGGWLQARSQNSLRSGPCLYFSELPVAWANTFEFVNFVLAVCLSVIDILSPLLFYLKRSFGWFNNVSFWRKKNRDVSWKQMGAGLFSQSKIRDSLAPANHRRSHKLIGRSQEIKLYAQPPCFSTPAPFCPLTNQTPPTPHPLLFTRRVSVSA